MTKVFSFETSIKNIHKVLEAIDDRFTFVVNKVFPNAISFTNKTSVLICHIYLRCFAVFVCSL